MELLPLIKHINDIIGIKRTDKYHIAGYMEVIKKKNNSDSFVDHSIYNFFESIVLKFEWSRLIDIRSVEIIYNTLDGSTASSKVLFKYLDIFERAIKVYLISNNIKYKDYISAVVSSTTMEPGFDEPRAKILAQLDTQQGIFVRYPWLATLFILSNTDLYYILSIDVVLEATSVIVE